MTQIIIAGTKHTPTPPDYPVADDRAGDVGTIQRDGAIMVANDADLRQTLQGQEMAEFVGTLLATTYPGYRWRIEAHPNGARPFVDFEPEIGLARGTLGHIGATVVFSDFYSASSLKAKILDLAGQMLEIGQCNRRAFDEVEFVGRAKDGHGMIAPAVAEGIILPAGARV